jgi:8-oxo-dGTP pyrophosphatase MutT (NUDIX family)
MIFDLPDGRFNFRIAGVCLHEGHVLLQSEKDNDRFWTLPGGHVELHENSESTLKRELMGELGHESHIERLLWIVENFFPLAGRNYHELLLIYRVLLPELEYLGTNRTFSNTDGGVDIFFKWFPIERVGELPLYPIFLRKALHSLPAQTEHVLNRE